MDQKQSKIIEQLYMEMFQLLYSYARSVLVNEALAEEAVQETFRIACLRPSELCSSPNPRGWLVATLKNVLRNTKKTQYNAQRLMAEYTAVYGSSPIFHRDQLKLELGYGNLVQKKEFQLLHQWAVEGKTIRELSREHGISVSACKKRLQRAKEYLRKKLS